MKRSLIKYGYLFLLLPVLSSCWNTEWSEERRINFSKQCSAQTTFDGGGMYFTGFKIEELNNAIIIEKKDQKVIDTLYIQLYDHRNEHDKKHQRYWGKTSKEELTVNHSYEFVFGDDKPYTLHKMEMTMNPQYTMGGEKWGCEMGYYWIDEQEFDQNGNISFTKRGFEYE